MVQILTSSWRTPVDDSRFIRVAISRSTPRGMKGYRRYSRLQPGDWFRSVVDPCQWAARYHAEVLGPLDPAEVVAHLEAMSDGEKDVALCCWEAAETGPEDWCHRGLISAWLEERLGLEVFELGRESCGCGRGHPKLPPVLRQR